MKSLITLCLLVTTVFSCKKEISEIHDDASVAPVDLRGYASISPALEMLTKGLALAHNDLWITLPDGKLYNPVSDIIFRQATTGVSKYYAISYDKLLNEAESRGIELDNLMNDKIRTLYSLTDTSNIVRNIIADNTYGGKTQVFHIVVPFLDTVAGLSPDQYTELMPITESKIAALNNKIPYFAYNVTGTAYPVAGYKIVSGSITATTIQASTVISRPVFFSAFFPLTVTLYTVYSISSPGFYKYINDCTVLLRACQECPSVNTDASLTNSLGGGGFDYEIGINLNENVCFATNTGGEDYAVVKAMPGFNYYYDNGCIPRRSVHKVTDPLYSEVSSSYGNYLTLCNPENRFHSLGEAVEDGEYGMASGGLYSLIIPGATANPIYFSFPFGKEFWYSNGPDMDINLDLAFDGSSVCTIPVFDDFLDIISSQYTNRNEFYQSNMVDPSNNRYISSTDYTTIAGYWSSDKINVGISTVGSEMVQAANMWEFLGAYGVITPTVPADLGPEIGELVKWTGTAGCTSGSFTWYDIANKFFTGYNFYPSDELILHIYATFEDGKKIDEYKYITLGTHVYTEPYKELRSFFRGQIVDYYIKAYEKL